MNITRLSRFLFFYVFIYILYIHIYFYKLGNERDAANKDIIDSLAITHVLNVTAHLPEHFKSSGIIYKRLPANDSSQQDLMKYFDQAFEFIGKIFL